ncbi:MAG: phosphoribosylformylglycinamidine synthase [Bacteroidota bacterium]|nr:phosphoribosylformylglycinamidine synthase [Bacteroidota bacterium]
MIIFFKSPERLYVVGIKNHPEKDEIRKLTWLFGEAELLESNAVEGTFIGPRREMITPWSTNAVEITQNMGITGILRIEAFRPVRSSFVEYDPMLENIYHGLDQQIFQIKKEPDPIRYVDDFAEYNQKEGLALSEEEIQYLCDLSQKLGRKLTDSEIFGFSQVNSEHCRHKIFNGTFVIDGKEMPESLFGLIRKTSQENPNYLVSAYKDNVAFIQGPVIRQFAPARQDTADFFVVKDIQSVISMKAETHNFPTTVEPFNGAATGSGGEIRDRMAGGKGSIPLAGTAVYMTSYPRLGGGRSWEKDIEPRKWLYKTPEEILIRASNGASDFGNKFGQPLICGSLLTFEHAENGKFYGYDKVIMLAGGVGFGRKEDSLKDSPEAGQKIVVLGGDNYRIGMGGGAVSSVATGEYGNAIELNAVQRSNPEMQKRVFNALRAMAEMDKNPVISLHDHGAGGHLNCISELVEDTGGTVHVDALPIGDPTLSDKEIISNESQERMGLVLKQDDMRLLKKIADRERAPMYDTGETTGDHQLVFDDRRDGTRPIDLKMEDFFGKPPKTVMVDADERASYLPPDEGDLQEGITRLLEEVLQLEAVACKDWLTNKVDRAVSGKIALQQTCGPVQLPLSDLGVVALDYTGTKGIATSIGHAPVAALVDPEAGSRLSIAEALTNLVWTPLTYGLKGVSLSANWMWPCKNPGEDARLYRAVQAVSDFAIALGINIPTGKDSLSMTQKYPDGNEVYSPGTVIISAAAETQDVKKSISPVLSKDEDAVLVYIDMSGDERKLGGSSLAQTLNRIGDSVPDIKDADSFARIFQTIQSWIKDGQILAGHDISSGGLITTLLEMTFTDPGIGLDLDLTGIGEPDLVKLLFCENPGVVMQIKDGGKGLKDAGFKFYMIGHVINERIIRISHPGENLFLDPDHLRDIWFHTSYLLDCMQSGEKSANERAHNYKVQPLKYRFPEHFTGKASGYKADPDRTRSSGVKAAIIREQGVNRDRDTAWALYLAGFDVKDVHMTDLISGRENLEDVNFIVFVGGFSNSDVLGSAKGWAGSFLFNEKAKKSLDNFFARKDTLSLGICNGCQLLVELGLIYPDHPLHPKMSWNDSHKFECEFTNISIQKNHSVMLGSLEGTRLGIWIAHGEGKFNFPYPEEKYHIPAKYSYHGYPGNPNGSMYDAACIASDDGRHLAIMPHLEDCILPWQWAYYPPDRANDEITPWIEAFVNAKNWIQEQIKENLNN